MLHHVSIIVRELEPAKAFYRDVLLLKEIERPPFDFEGAWYGLGEGQQLHLIVHDGETRRNGGIDTRDGHFALRVASYSKTLAWLDRCGVSYEARPHAKAGFPQIYVLDPDHNIIELNADALD
ncbi:VOC family protein [Paenibacillus thalictri]